MKKSGCLLLILFFSLTTSAQQKINLSEELTAAEKERSTYWKPGLYDKAIESMQRAYNIYLTADSVDKKSLFSIETAGFCNNISSKIL